METNPAFTKRENFNSNPRTNSQKLQRSWDMDLSFTAVLFPSVTSDARESSGDPITTSVQLLN